MSIYANATAQDLIILRKLAVQQKEQRAKKISERNLKQTHDIKLAESLSPITKNFDEVNKTTQESLSPITKKFDTINESSKQLSEIVKESNSEKREIINTPIILLQVFFTPSVGAPSSLKLNQDNEGKLNTLGVPLTSLGGDKIQAKSKIYEFTPEIHKALSQTSYTCKSMKDDNDQITLYNVLADIGYDGQGDEKTNQKNFFTRLLKLFGNTKEEELDNVKSQGIEEIIIPSEIIDIYTRLEVSLGVTLSGQNDTPTEA